MSRTKEWLMRNYGVAYISAEQRQKQIADKAAEEEAEKRADKQSEEEEEQWRQK